jgi:uncharacterized lipoprotein YddW (UPF0748 family)
MTPLFHNLYYFLMLFVVALTCPQGLNASTYIPANLAPPTPSREFRAAWVATVGNIDWPSTNNLSVAGQQAEMIAIIEHASRLKLNAIILQVRPACDAIYASSLEPWSEYLTGEMGRPPSPFYDPLKFAVSEAHKRGLELHAWFNPYRARHAAAKSAISTNHISKRRPDLVRQYGPYLWLDPGEKEVRDYSLSVVMDVVKNYDVDGIHFDDYFYPYRETGAGGKELDFPDWASWKKYGLGGKLSRDDWRRENVNQFVHRVSTAIHTRKPWVKFGISPFGIWRPGNPAEVRGFDAYDKLYADARKWLQNGWVDYMAPQLYWAIDAPQQSYPSLLNWWAEQNARKRQIWPGLNSYNVGRTWKPEEIVNQVRLTRKQPGATGHIHWNMRRGLMAPNGLSAALERQVYQLPALTPSVRANPAGLVPPAVRLTVTEQGKGVRVSWPIQQRTPVARWLLQWRVNGAWTSRVLGPNTTWWAWETSRPEAISIRLMDRYGVLGAPNSVQRKATTPRKTGRAT